MHIKKMEKAVGQRIKIIREELAKSQAEFIIPLGITQPALSQMEKGLTFPSVDTMQNISKSYNVNLNWLLIGTGKHFNIGNADPDGFQVLKDEIEILKRDVELLKALNGIDANTEDADTLSQGIERLGKYIDHLKTKRAKLVLKK
jgi:transcriptional regulator with XRE-family HTH domain